MITRTDAEAQADFDRAHTKDAPAPALEDHDCTEYDMEASVTDALGCMTAEEIERRLRARPRLKRSECDF